MSAGTNDQQARLDAPTLERLGRLRALLADAVAQAADVSALGRHRAVIALDGACENAMGIALDSLTRARAERDFPKKLSQLEGILPNWNAEGRLGVSALHTARNQAQHHGVVSDFEEVGRWATEADRFVRSLVVAAFALRLQDVHTAAAVADEHLRNLVLMAEMQLEAGDAPAAFESSWGALEAARRRWGAQRGLHGQGIRPSPVAQASDALGTELRDSISQIDDYVEVSIFATDFGEFVWFAAQRRESIHRSPPTADDARRALVFVLSWVLRWESFNARFPADRWKRWWEGRRPPQTGLSNRRPVILEVRQRPSVLPAGLGLCFQLADVPHDDDDAYGERWDTYIYSAFEELRAGDQVPLPHGTRISMGLSGELNLDIPREGDPDADAIIGVVQGLIDTTQRLYEERQDAIAQARRKADEMARPYRETLEALKHPEVTFESVTASPGTNDTQGDVRDTITLSLELADGLTNFALQDLIRREMGHDEIRGMGTDLRFFRDALTPQDAATLIVTAVESLRTRVDKRAEAGRIQKEKDERLRADLEKRLVAANPRARDNPS